MTHTTRSQGGLTTSPMGGQLIYIQNMTIHMILKEKKLRQAEIGSEKVNSEIFKFNSIFLLRKALNESIPNHDH